MKQLFAGTVALLLTSIALPSFAEELRFINPPKVMANPNKSVPLAALVRFETNQPGKTTVRVSDGENHWQFRYEKDRDTTAGLPVVGFRPDRRHTLTIKVNSEDGEELVSKPLVFRSPPLPSEPELFPAINITKQSERAEPGYRLFNPRRRIPRQTQAGNEKERRFGESFGMLMIVDQAGTPVWYYRTDSRIAGFDIYGGNRILYVTADYRIVEIDLLGNTTRSWYASQRPQGESSATAVDALTFHHDADLLPDGNLIALSTERRRIKEYYTSEYDSNAPRKDQWVMGDRVVEFSPQGVISWQWNAFEHLPVDRIGYETFSSYWQRRGFPETIDWSHANEVTKLPDGSIMINFRYQSAIVKVAVETGEIEWIFGEPSGFPKELQAKCIQLDSDYRWFWHQHAPTFTSRGTLLLFDNGNYRARPFDEPTPVAKTWSRAVEYKLDERKRTATQVWTSEGSGDRRVVTIAMGSAVEMPKSKNVLVGYGAILDPDHVDEIDWQTRAQIQQITRCSEYTRTQPPELVWELRLQPTGENPRIGWNIFGCQSVAELRP